MPEISENKFMKIKATVSSEVFGFFHDHLGFEYIDDFLEVIIKQSDEFKDYQSEKSK